jgi:preprotein translocase subunit SecA
MTWKTERVAAAAWLAAPFARHRLLHRAERVAAEMTRLRGLDAAAFATALAEARAALRLGRETDRGLTRVERALAVLGVVSEHKLDLRPRPLQLGAALAQYGGRVAWLPAGSGKSLAAALAAALHAWSGHPCRVVTVNGYLASRDAERMRPLYTGAGLSLGCVTEESAADPAAVAAAYRVDVVYASARQMISDSLREQVLRGAVDDPQRLRLRGQTSATAPAHLAVVVDDADLVLIDDAGSPLVISAPGDNPLLLEALSVAREIADQLEAGRDYQYSANRRELHYTAAGLERLDELGARLHEIWHDPERRDELVRQALAVRDLLVVGRHYQVEQGRVAVLDDGIGRVLAGRGWGHGLMQAIEARAGLAFSPLSRTLARMSYPRFFRRHAHLCGIGRGYSGAGTMLREHYGLASLRLVPEAVAPEIGVVACDGREAKLDALCEAAALLHAGGHPLLVVIRRGGDGTALQRRFAEREIVCLRLEARQMSGEAVMAVVDRGRVTLAQSAALLGIELPAAARPDLRVLLAEAHDLAHADRRAAGMADGHARLYLAPDDELLAQQSAWFGELARRVWPLAGGPRALIRLAQALAARGARKQGKLLARRDAMLNQQLAFTGEQDIDLGIYTLGKPGKDGT